MNIAELRSFVITAKCGSFQTAAKQLFLSSTALIKQINSLEDELGFKLFIRTNRGVLLTESGRIFLETSQDILRNVTDAIQRGRERSNQKSEPIRLGFSPINPYHHEIDQYYCREGDFSHFTTIMVPISGEFKDFMDEMRNLGTHVDVIPFSLGNRILEPMVQGFCLARIPMYIAVSFNHPLAARDIIRYEDLNAQILTTIADSVNTYYETFNAKILHSAPYVQLSPISFIDFETLNETAAGRNLLLAGGHLWNVHPHLRFIPLEEELLLPYGLCCAAEPSAIVSQFLQTFQANGISGLPEDAPVVYFR